ncbi:unnamed protein product [Acanthoscelides obtectus]|uniref:Dpy-30-like protein n=1 Tax=Acanthoscelides obtectus TaxID=200917 RepID=A0A9P0M9J3_ACAOB|nr:unnamed protein product [Acanthoscelides obtectus]CAK1629190.1 Protein dpy-30 homolog [Acanthoscelides obtectus]
MENKQGEASKKARIELSSLPTRQYLDQTVVPALLTGLNMIARERPADPLAALGNYLLKTANDKAASTSHATTTD